MTKTEMVLAEVLDERRRQKAIWGEQNHPDGTGPEVQWMSAHDASAKEAREQLRARCQRRFSEGRGTWLDILLEEMAETFAERDPLAIRAELIQVAAVAVAWAEAIDRRLVA